MRREWLVPAWERAGWGLTVGTWPQRLAASTSTTLSADFVDNWFRLDQAELEEDLRTGTWETVRVGIFTKERLVGNHRRYLIKRVSKTRAWTGAFATILANQAGIATPLCLPWALEGAHGAAIPWIDNSVAARPDYQWRAATQRVLAYVLLTRWFNELIGNQDCWYAQFVEPESASGAELVAVDFEEAFTRRTATWLQSVLAKAGLTAALADCRWTDKEFDFETALAFDPLHYDSPFTFYGQLWSAYGMGDCELPIDLVRKMLSDVAATVPLSVVRSTALNLVANAAAENFGLVPLQAAHVWLEPETFVDAFARRFERSLVEMERFLVMVSSPLFQDALGVRTNTGWRRPY